MILIRRTYSLTGLWLLPVILIGSIFCFYMIRYISYEETDEFLTYEMDRLVEYHKKFKDLPEYSQVAGIIPDMKLDAPLFRDTLILEPGDNEMIPHRELLFSIQHKERYFTIVLRQLMPGSDDIAEGTIMIIGGFMTLIVVFLILVLNVMNRRIWSPFYSTLTKLKSFRIHGAIPEFSRSSIDEFESLNSTLKVLLKKIADDYKNNKEFNENASHELQTHLAVIRTNAEKLINDQSGKFDDLQELNTIYKAATKLSQIQRSLLLLSKISNREYNDDVALDIRTLILDSMEIYKEAIELRGIRLDQYCESTIVNMDAGLAAILINNLMKNAVKHNIENGFISIRLDASGLTFKNPGMAYEGNPEVYMKRFVKGETGNHGIGLAIVKQICDLYNFNVSYSVTSGNEHIIRILF